MGKKIKKTPLNKPTVPLDIRNAPDCGVFARQ